jgi:hypothetical protein
MLNEAHSMAARTEQNISLSEIRYLFTSCILIMESFVVLGNFICDFQEEGEQTTYQHGTAEDTVEELEPKKDDEVSTCAPPSEKSIHIISPPAQ